MSAGAQAHGWNGPSRRRIPRYRVQAPLDVTVLRSGIPDTVPGRSVNLCERGIAAMLAAELKPGEAVGVEVWLPQAQDSLRTRALVRYQDQLRCGMEFVGLSAEQRAAIRDWAGQSKVETELEVGRPPAVPPQSHDSSPDASAPNQPDSTNRKGHGRAWAILLVVAIVLFAGFWWRWSRGWQELESGLPNHGPSSVQKPPVQVPTEVMERLLVHKVDPDYPPAARQAKLRGLIAVDVVVGRDGSVVEMRPLNGPEVLARSAMEALRWWRFEPYRVNGEPVVSETTIAMEFKP